NPATTLPRIGSGCTFRQGPPAVADHAGHRPRSAVYLGFPRKKGASHATAVVYETHRRAAGPGSGTCRARPPFTAHVPAHKLVGHRCIAVAGRCRRPLVMAPGGR